MIKAYQLADDESWRGVFRDNGDGFAGIYRLHVMDGESFRPLPRLLDTDPRGTLYIGASANVPKRLGLLRRSIGAAYRHIDSTAHASLQWASPSDHQTGGKIANIPRFVAAFPYSSLAITVQPLDPNDPSMVKSAGGHYELETRLLRDYETEYGEKPALNG